MNADVSRSFKKLQAEKLAADKVLRELTSVEGIDNVDALRDYLQNASLTVEVCTCPLYDAHAVNVRLSDGSR
jgi:hypothetical protein